MKICKIIRNNITALLSLVLIFTMLINISGCMSVKAENLMKGIESTKVSGKQTDDRFIENTADFGVELFKKTYNSKESSLISPLSVLLALSMTANGADNTTLSQMETLLGKDIPLDELNEYLYTYVSNLPDEEKSKLKIANSIWFSDEQDRLSVEKDFLQKNADYYNAAAYKSAFDARTLKDINNWVKEKTDGTIDKIIEQIDENAVMYLINAMVFDAEWENIYTEDKVRDGTFTAVDGTKQTVKFMTADEDLYIEDAKASGFIKQYKGGRYSFAALLPREGISIEDYIDSLTGEGLIETLKNVKSADFEASIPKFSYEYSINMNDALIELGMPDAFDESTADFSRIDKSKNNIFISRVLHKSYISVDECGTKAGAATAVEMEYGAFMHNIRLDRPFVYAILDNSTNLPVFIGAVMSINN